MSHTNGSDRCIVVGMLLAVLLGAAIFLAAFILYPRSPEFSIHGLVPSNVNSNPQNELSLDLTVPLNCCTECVTPVSLQVYIDLHNPNFLTLTARNLSINFTYSNEVLGSCDAAYFRLRPRFLNVTSINAHLYTSSPAISATIMAQILQQGSFALNYTGSVAVKYLGIHARKAISGTKTARIAPVSTTHMARSP